MRGWVCRLQLLLALASLFILGSVSRGTHDHILLSQIRDSPNQEGQVPVFTFSWNRMTQLYPQALGSLLLRRYFYRGNVFTVPLHRNGYLFWVCYSALQSSGHNTIHKIMFT
jgi:hypothetical protein